MSRLRPTSSALLLVLALLALCPAVMAQPGDGITMGRLTLRPYVDGSLTYDSNVQPLQVDATDPLAPVLKEVSDTLYEVRVGTSVLWFHDDWLINGSVWGFRRSYQDLDLEDEDGFGLRFAFAGGDRDRLAWGAFQSFERRFDFGLDALEGDLASATPASSSPARGGDLALEDEFARVQFERDLHLLGVQAGRNLGDRMELDVGYGYREINYQDERLFSESGHAMSLSLGRRLFSETTAFVQGNYGQEDNENYVDAVPYYQVLAGLRSAANEKISYNVGVGYQHFETAEQRPRVLEDGSRVLNDGTLILEDGTSLAPEPLRNPVTGEFVEDVPGNEEDSQSGFAYNIGLGWRPTRKLSFGLSGRNEYRASFTGDQREVQLAQLSAWYVPLEPFQISLRVGYWMEEALNEILLINNEGNETRIKDRRETLTVVGRIAFRPPEKWYELYADVTYEEVQSNLNLQSYDRLRIGCGLRVTY